MRLLSGLNLETLVHLLPNYHQKRIENEHNANALAYSRRKDLTILVIVRRYVTHSQRWKYQQVQEFGENEK